MDIEKMRLLASNVFKAHKEAIEDGIFDWSEANYLRYALGYVHYIFTTFDSELIESRLSLNVTDFIAGAGGPGMWGDLYDTVYFAA